MAVYKRRQLTEFVLRYWAELKERVSNDVPMDLWAALSPDDPHLDEFEHLCLELGWNYAVVDNHPLWTKWNGLVKAMRQSVAMQDVQGVLVMGSDDIANDAFVRGAWALLRSGVDYIQPTGCCMFHPESGRMSFLSAFQGGAGRVFSGNLCDRLNWKLWRDNPDMKSVDLWQEALVKGHKDDIRMTKFPISVHGDWHMMDIKTSGGENMWDWEQFSPNHNILTQWLDAGQTLESTFPGYFEAIEEEVAA